MSKEQALIELERALGYITSNQLSHEDKGRIVKDAIANYNTYINYFNALMNFKKGSSSNVTGIYNNNPMLLPNQQGSVIFKFFPLIREK